MGYKSVQNAAFDSQIVKFTNEGDSFEGFLSGIRRGITTPSGLADVADFQGLDGKNYAIFLSAGMRSRLNEDLIGRQIQVTYRGEQKNPKTGRTFKAFDVEMWVDDSGEEDQIPF